jgi:ABC-2 type transport system ATP-binding protein
MITGIFYPDEGEIIFNGRPFDPANDIRHIGYMPEERGLYKKMKIGEQALYLAQLKGLGKNEAMQLIKEWFTKLDMQSWWNKKVEDLSKGMSQKLQFVTTVLHQPKLIILDEPFSGLDPVNSNIIKDEIYGLAKKGATIIFSTHRMEQVEEICDQIVLVNKGKKILDGTVKNVKQDFKKNLFKIGFGSLPGNNFDRSFEIAKHNDDHSLIVKINEGYSPNDVLGYYLQQQNPILSFNEILPSLTEIFIQLVEGTAASRQFSQYNYLN